MYKFCNAVIACTYSGPNMTLTCLCNEDEHACEHKVVYSFVSKIYIPPKFREINLPLGRFVSGTYNICFDIPLLFVIIILDLSVAYV